MTEIQTNVQKTKGRFFIENVLFVLCMAIITLRSLSIESPNTTTTNPWFTITDELSSLSLSTSFLAIVLIWFIQSVIRRKFFYRYTAIELGLIVFIIASCLSISVASNLRSAITGFVTILTPMLAAVILVQTLCSPKRVKALLYTLACLGVVSAFYSVLQFFWVNPMLIEQYQGDPTDFLSKLAIVPGSFRHMLFEHSLYSRDIRSFFTTGNSAGSFAILTLAAAVALLADKLRRLKSSPKSLIAVCVLAFIALLCLTGLLITRSKGAILSVIIAAAMLVIYLSSPMLINRHKRAILIFGLLLAFFVIALTVWYGSTHDRLPGGNSMLVRWQYWYSSARMYAAHPFTGVGPGNFAYYYPQYKIPAALETVTDPHNFLLNILTQFGPLGLIGFLAAVFMPLGRLIFADAKNQGAGSQSQSDRKKSFLRSLSSTPIGEQESTSAILFVAVIGFLIHNCIDFAMFEPAILTVFWVIIAVIIALDRQRKNAPVHSWEPKIAIRIAAIVMILVLVMAFVGYAFLPVARATRQMEKAGKFRGRLEFENANNLLRKAAMADTYNPLPLTLNAQLYMQRFYADVADETLLLNAENDLLGAIKRNPAYFKDYEKLADLYLLLAQSAEMDKKNQWLNKAYLAANEAVMRYPGLARIKMRLADIAEQLGKIDVAVENYRKAVEIEDAYRQQFKMMYPGRAIFSRLGEDQYQTAIDKIKLLTP